MALQTCCCSTTELGPPIQAYNSFSSPRNLHTRCSLNSKLLPGFNSRCNSLYLIETKKFPSKHRFFVSCYRSYYSETAPVRKKKMKTKNPAMISLLRELRDNEGVEKVLDLCRGKLTPRERTTILAEQSKWFMVVRIFDYFNSQEEYAPDEIHYNVVLRALGRAQKWHALRLYWIEMAKNGVMPSNTTYSILVDAYGKAGLAKEALFWIKHMRLRGIFPDEITMCTVLKALKDAGEYDKGDRFYKNWCLGKVDVDDLDLENMADHQHISWKQFLSSELFRIGARSHYSTEFEGSVSKPQLTSTYNTLIDLYGKAGRLEDAADVLADMLNVGVAPDTITFNTMIYTCGTNGYMSEAEALLDKMEESGIRPDTQTYNIFITLYSNVGNIDGAIQFYRKIRESGLFLDDVTCRLVLKILSERNMVDEVEALIREMEKFNKSISESSIPLLIKMYASAGLPDRAKFLIEKFQSYGWFTSKSYAAIMDFYAENGLLEEAEALFYSNRDGDGQKKDVEEYNVMIKAYGNSKLYDEAMSLFTGMRNQGMWPDECTYNSIIQMLAGGDFDHKARELLAEMQAVGFKPLCSTFTAVISCLTKKNRMSDAVDVYQEVLRIGVKPDDVVYGSLIDGFIEDGQFEEANEYFKMMVDSGISPNQITLTSMIKGYGKIGSLEAAKELYEKMKTFHGGPDIMASNAMLNLYAEMGIYTEAKALYRYLREKNKYNLNTIIFMMNCYKNIGLFNEAVEVAKEVKECGLLTDCVAYRYVMACYAANEQLVECGELLYEMTVTKKILPDSTIYFVLFAILKRGDMPIAAVRQLETAYEEGKPFVEQALITHVYALVGLNSYALEMCGKFKTKGEQSLNSLPYNAAIHALTACGKTHEALSMVMRMREGGVEPDVVTYIHLVKCYGNAGMIEAVGRIQDRMRGGLIEPCESLYQAIIDAYKNTHRYDLAKVANAEMKLAFQSEDEHDMMMIKQVGCSMCPDHIEFLYLQGSKQVNLSLR